MYDKMWVRWHISLVNLFHFFPSSPLVVQREGTFLKEKPQAKKCFSFAKMLFAELKNRNEYYEPKNKMFSFCGIKEYE